jgi:hypothetical protein
VYFPLDVCVPPGYLAPGYDELKGDTFAAACRLLLASPATVSALRSMSLGQLFGAETWALREELHLLDRFGDDFSEFSDQLLPSRTNQRTSNIAWQWMSVIILLNYPTFEV